MLIRVVLRFLRLMPDVAFLVHDEHDVDCWTINNNKFRTINS